MSSPLVIIHGWTYTIEPWTKTVELLRNADIEVIQLRVPGLTTPSDDIWTIDSYVAWLEKELANIPNPIVLGHSNGGRIAMHYLTTHPGAFEKLILLNSAGVETAPSTLSTKRRVVRAASKLLAPLKHVPGVRKAVYKILGSDYGRAPKNMQATLQNMLACDKDFSPRHIETPTILLWGESDSTTPLAMGMKIANEMPHALIHMYPTWRHAPYITHPEQLAQAIQSAIEEKV